MPLSNVALRALLVTAVSALLGFLGAQPALGHTVQFTIWGYGETISSLADNHYWCSPPYWPSCPTGYDYYIQTSEDVYQSYAGQGDFRWDQLKLPGGGNFQGTAYFGSDSYIIDGTGVSHYDWVTDLSCQPVTNDIWMALLQWNGGSEGAWVENTIHSGGNSCYIDYQQDDSMVVDAGQ